MGNSTTNDWAANADNPLITNAIVKVGWLIKKGSTRKNWNKRYVLLLQTSILLYFTDSNCREHRGTADFIKLKNVGTINKEPSKFVVVTANRTWEFKAADKRDAMDWVKKIKQIYNDNKNKNKNKNKQNNTNKNNEDDIKKDAPQNRKDTKLTFEYEMKMVRGGLMGWLTKKGELRRNWNSRWTILIPSRLMIYFTDETCENFKGCADFRESNLTLLFDDIRANYFFIQTHMRLWEFSCKNSHHVQQWSTILQYLIDIDKKVLILRSADPDSDYPTKDILRNHFKSNGNILDIIFIGIDKSYVIIFDNETAVEQLMLQKRQHIISYSVKASPSYSNASSCSNNSYSSNPPLPASPSPVIANIPEKYRKKPFRSRRHRSSLRKYELFTLKFSEYMGAVHNSFGSDIYQFNTKKSYKSKVHSVASATRRFSTKTGTTTGSGKKKKGHRTRDISKSLSFRDKYSQSAIDEFKRIYAQQEIESKSDDDYHENSNDSINRKKLSTIIDSTDNSTDNSVVNGNDDNNDWDDAEEEEDVYYDDTSSSDDEKNGNVRMTSVAQRGIQQYYDPNQLKTYRDSAIFNFSPEKHNKSILDISPKQNIMKKRSREKMKSLPILPTLEQGDEYNMNQNEEKKEEKKENNNNNKIKRRPSTKKEKPLPGIVSVNKLKKEIAESPMLRHIVSKPKYCVLNKNEDIGKFLDHIDKTLGLPNFARYVAMSDGNTNRVEAIYRNYRKKDMTGDALKKIEMEEKEIMEKEEKEEQTKRQQQQEKIHLNLKRKINSNSNTNINSNININTNININGIKEMEEEYDEEVEYEEEIEYEEVEEGCPIIIDNGSGYIKAGFDISDIPKLIPTQCAKSKSLIDEYILFGDDSGLRNDTMTDIGDIIFPIKRDKIIDWNAMNAIWKYVCLNKIGIDEMYDYPIMITEAPGTEKKYRERELQHFMEEYNLQKFYMMNTALANFYYTGKSRDDYCVIVDCGHETTNISCIYMGMYHYQYASTIEYGGKDITTHLSSLMSNTSMYFHLDTSYKIANKIKIDYCYVARDFMMARNNMIKRNYTLPDGRTLEIKQEQYEAPEILFCPSDPKHNKRRGRGGNQSKKALHSILINCVNKIDDDDVEKNMYANIYCCGGSVKLTNFTSRLQTELTRQISRRMSIVSPQHIRKGVVVKNVNKPHLSAWYGCKIITSMSNFDDKWITANQYNEYGPNILLRKCTHQDV